MAKPMNKQQKKSDKFKQPAADHGEVFTPVWLVEAMLDLRIPGRCGTLNLYTLKGRVPSSGMLCEGKLSFPHRI